LPSRCEETIYSMLSDESVTPNEIAKRLGVTHKTAKDALMHLAVTRKGCALQELWEDTRVLEGESLRIVDMLDEIKTMDVAT